MRISDWSSDVCSSDLADPRLSGQMQSTNLGNQRTQQQMATDAAIAPWALRQAKASALAAEVGLQDKLKPKIDPATAGRSEGRSVGKECVRKWRIRRSPYHRKKQHK